MRKHTCQPAWCTYSLASTSFGQADVPVRSPQRCWVVVKRRISRIRVSQQEMNPSWERNHCRIGTPSDVLPLLYYIWLLNAQTITIFVSILKQDPDQQHAQWWCPRVDKSKAIVIILLDQASGIVWRLYTAPNIGNRLNVMRPYGMRSLLQRLK